MTKPYNKEDLPEEFYDVLYIIDYGAKKHGKDTWLNPSNPSMKHKANMASIFRHASACSEKNYIDPETGRPHWLNIACRALMEYTRQQRGIIESDE